MPLYKGEEVIVGRGFTAPINFATVAVSFPTVAHDAPHDALPFEMEQLIPPFPEERAEWGN